METEEIIEKIIKEQDLLGFYAIRATDVMFDKYITEPPIEYEEIYNYFFEREDILERVSTQNLMNLMFRMSEKAEVLKPIIRKRIEKEGFFYEDIEFEDFFMKANHSIDYMLNKLGSENAKVIKSKVREELDKVEVDKEILGGLGNFDDAANFLKYYQEGIFTQEKIELLKEMLKKNKNAFVYMNFGIFQDDIFSIGKEFVEYISKFPTISKQIVILQKHNPELLNILANRIKQYEKLPDSYEEVDALIKYFTKHTFEIDASKIQTEKIQDLVECAIREKNRDIYYNKINAEYSDNYNEDLEAEFQSRYKRAYFIDDKKNVYLNKRFAMSLSEATKFVESYGEDIKNVDGLTEEDVQIFNEIKRILRIKEKSEVDELFSICKMQYKATDILNLKSKISKVFAQDHANGLQKTHDRIEAIEESNEQEWVEEIEFEGKKIRQIRLNKDFQILVHSTDSGFINESKADENVNFKQLWGSGDDKANHIISMSLINQDFLGCAPVNEKGVMYGFSTIKSDNIRLMGNTDINTYSRAFSYKSIINKNISAQNMGYSSRRVYNEFGVERANVTPDYVILFDDMEEQVKINTYKAARDFGIPIIFIDKKEIEMQQLDNLERMRSEFLESRNPEILNKLLNIYETNVAGWLLNRSEKETDESYTSAIQNTRFKEDFEKAWGQIETTIYEYLNTIQEGQLSQKDIESLVSIMENVLHEKDLYKGSEETKPISKTSISYDVKSIVRAINSTFKRLDLGEYQVDEEQLPTSEEYSITIKEIVKNALSGQNRVNSEDIQSAEAVIKAIEQCRGKTQEEQGK